MPPEAEVAAYPESAKMLLASANAHILRERSTVSELRRMLQVTQARYDRANLAREIFLARSSGGTYTSAQNAVKAADTLLALTYPKVADDIRDVVVTELTGVLECDLPDSDTEGKAAFRMVIGRIMGSRASPASSEVAV